MQNYYVYQYADPKNKVPFYIGKGKGLRVFAHLLQNQKSSGNYYKYNKIKSIMNTNVLPEIRIIKHSLTHEEACILEKELILKYGRIHIDENGILTNRTPGGEGGSGPKSKETRQKISEKHKNKIVSIETRKKISLAGLGRIPPNKNVPISDELREKIINATRGIKKSDKGRENITVGQRTRRKREREFKEYWLSHDGVVYKTNELKEFANIHGLKYGNLWNAYNSKSLNPRGHKGWRKAEPTSNYICEMFEFT